MNQKNLLDVDWSKIPAPTDDGGAAHLKGIEDSRRQPARHRRHRRSICRSLRAAPWCSPIRAPASPARSALVDDWDMIPGARGCTPQTCSFRDLFAELKAAGAAHVFGLSTQNNDYQTEMAARLHLPFPVLSDEKLAADRGAEAADHGGRGADADQAAGADRRRRPHHPCVLSGVSAGPERRRRAGLAEGQSALSRRSARAPARTPRGTSPPSARRCSCCSASSDSCRTARTLPSRVLGAVRERAAAALHAQRLAPSMSCAMRPSARMARSFGIVAMRRASGTAGRC